ncbi:MAG: extracellular solute-binding protein, partial [Anaerolineae bacterium]|nr:extracellular solute-binding protein [Anaerolineae bacterium]NIN97196.1 extracellular solute-binding protein [Anaerolineae bacterium]NIQ82814.1 extracellular solute-binding protein [Anaerolineae bacterium]
MRRGYLWLSTLVVLGLMLAACAPPTTPAPTTPPEETPVAPPPTPVPPEPTPVPEKVTLLFSDWHLTEPHWEAALIEAFDIYMADHPNIDIELDYVSYADKETKYTTEIEAGMGPDVFHLHGYSLKSFIEKGYLYDITSFIEAEEGVYGGDFLTPWFPQTLELMQDEGKYYALPGDFMSMVVFYNKNLFEEAGLDPAAAPATWDEFEDYATTLTRDRDGDGAIDTWGFGTIGAIDPGFELRFTPILFSHGGDYLTPDNKCSALNSPEAKEAFQFFVELVTVHEVIPPGVTAQNPGTVRQQMANEQIAMLLGSGWTPPIVDTNNPDLGALDVLEAAPVPVKAGLEPEFTTTAWISAWMISPNTEHPEEAWELLKFITSKEMEEKWFDDARVLSSRMDVSGGLEDQGVEAYPELLADKFAAVIAGELAHAKFVPQLKEWPQIIEAVNTAAQEGFTGAKSP